MTDVKLEKVSVIDKYLFIEKGLRGGISYIAKRYAQANKKHMKKHTTNKYMTLKNHQHLLCTWILIMCMVGK